jgi:hypothetical protein
MKLILENMESYSGTALEIIQQMKGSAMFADNKSIREYLDMVMKNAHVHHKTDLEIRGETDEDLARSLIFQIVEHHLGMLMEEDSK